MKLRVKLVLVIPMEFTKSYLPFLMANKLAFVNGLQHIALSDKKVMRVEMEVIKEARPVKQPLRQAFKYKFTEGGGERENKERKIEGKETGGKERKKKRWGK